jgi:hypothetical protein
MEFKTALRWISVFPLWISTWFIASAIIGGGYALVSVMWGFQENLMMNVFVGVASAYGSVLAGAMVAPTNKVRTGYVLVGLGILLCSIECYFGTVKIDTGARIFGNLIGFGLATFHLRRRLGLSEMLI